MDLSRLEKNIIRLNKGNHRVLKHQLKFLWRYNKELLLDIFLKLTKVKPRIGLLQLNRGSFTEIALRDKYFNSKTNSKFKKMRRTILLRRVKAGEYYLTLKRVKVIMSFKERDRIEITCHVIKKKDF